MRKIDGLLLADTFETLIAKLEAFRDQFEHMATTTDQRELAAQFSAFVGETIRAFYPSHEGSGCDPEAATEEQLFWKEAGHESAISLFAEIRADEAAAKREDAHWYAKDAFKKLLDRKSETPPVEMGKDHGIERGGKE